MAVNVYCTQLFRNIVHVRAHTHTHNYSNFQLEVRRKQSVVCRSANQNFQFYGMHSSIAKKWTHIDFDSVNDISAITRVRSTIFRFVPKFMGYVDLMLFEQYQMRQNSFITKCFWPIFCWKKPRPSKFKSHKLSFEASQCKLFSFFCSFHDIDDE